MTSSNKALGVTSGIGSVSEGAIYAARLGQGTLASNFAKLSRDAVQTVSAGTWETVIFDANVTQEQISVSGTYDAVVIEQPGVYLIDGYTYFSDDTVDTPPGVLGIRLNVNGTTKTKKQMTMSDDSDYYMGTRTIVKLEPGDEVSMQVYISDAATNTIGTAANSDVACQSHLTVFSLDKQYSPVTSSGITVSAANITGDLVVGGNLDVSGTSNMVDANLSGNMEITGTLDVTADTTLADLYVSNIYGNSPVKFPHGIDSSSNTVIANMVDANFIDISDTANFVTVGVSGTATIADLYIGASNVAQDLSTVIADLDYLEANVGNVANIAGTDIISDLNTTISDLDDKIHYTCVLKKTAAQTIGAAYTLITFPTVEFDGTSGDASEMADTGNSRIYCRKTGLYRVSLSFITDAKSDNRRLARMRFNGNSSLSLWNISRHFNSCEHTCSISELLSLTSGDYMEALAYHSSSSDINAGSYAAYMGMQYIGPTS